LIRGRGTSLAHAAALNRLDSRAVDFTNSENPSCKIAEQGVRTPTDEGQNVAGGNLPNSVNLVAYQVRLGRALNCLTGPSIDQFTGMISVVRTSGSRLWPVGNGGSATTSDDFATDLLRCSDSEGRPVHATSLCSNIGAITASGNSPNILAAIEWAKDHSLTTIGLTGFDGGAARTQVDVSVHVESAKRDYGVVEDAHLVACHMVAEALRVDKTPIHPSEG
jgi:D-sedoheptulose 7-phosphate isomerase